MLCLLAAIQCPAQSVCQHFADEVKALKAERSGLQNDLKKAVGGQEKSLLANQIKQLIVQINAKQKQFDNCYRTTDLLEKCADQPPVYYTLPFDNDHAWVLTNGNWDDPSGHAHNPGNPNGLQAYAFDFVHDADKDHIGEGGQPVRAARGGVVYAFVESETGNSWGSGNPPGYTGVGNFLVIKHPDGTFGTYWHLSQNGVLVGLNQQVHRGDVIATSGNTGNSSTAHLHFDVRTNWSLGFPADHKEYPSVKIRFMDQLHQCWRPRVGDSLTPLLP